MKRYNNLFNKIIDIDNIYLAHQNARKRKTHYKEVRKIDANLDFYMYKIKEILENGQYVPSEYKIFKKVCGKKIRTIYKLPYFPDRIIHHAIFQILEPIFTKTFIRDTFQSIKGRGVHDARKRIQKSLKDENLTHALQIDIKKFYPNVDNDILKNIIRRKIKCNKTLDILDSIIDSNKGLPIGNYTSQILGNVYLSGFDHIIKENLKIKNYFRYCDDILILGNNSYDLHTTKREIFDLLDILKLSVNNNHKIIKIDDGIKFIGFVFYKNKVKLISNNAKNFKRKMLHLKKTHNNKNIRNSIMSYWGQVKYIQGKSLYFKYFDKELRKKMNKE